MTLVGQVSISKSSSGGKAPDVVRDLGLVLARTPELVNPSFGGPSKRCPGHELTYPGHGTEESGHVTQELRKLLFRGEPVSPPPCPRRCAFGGRIELRVACGRLADGGVEENECRITVGERQKRDQRRNGMKDADGRFASVATFNRFKNKIMVMNQRRNVVVPLGADGVPAVVPEVIDHQVEILREQQPEWVVEIDGEPVPMAQNEPGARGIPVPAHGGDRPLVEANLAHRERLGHFPDGFRSQAGSPDCPFDVIVASSVSRCRGPRAGYRVSRSASEIAESSATTRAKAPRASGLRRHLTYSGRVAGDVQDPGTFTRREIRDTSRGLAST